ncbi:hypothetical protein RUND412_007005, partial [Rhizina undulata]
ASPSKPMATASQSVGPSPPFLKRFKSPQQRLIFVQAPCNELPTPPVAEAELPTPNDWLTVRQADVNSQAY